MALPVALPSLPALPSWEDQGAQKSWTGGSRLHWDSFQALSGLPPSATLSRSGALRVKQTPLEREKLILLPVLTSWPQVPPVAPP